MHQFDEMPLLFTKSVTSQAVSYTHLPGDPPIEPIIFHSLVPPVREPGEPQPEIGEPETDEPVYDDEDELEDTGGDDYDALERDLEELPIC